MVLVLFIIDPIKYMNATIDGAVMFIEKVFPSLFPFFIIVKCLTALGVGNILYKYFEKPTRLLYNTSPLGGYVLVISMLSGYPLGAKLVTELVQSGQIEHGDARKIISFTSTSGPLFVLGTVGMKLLGDYKAGVIIFISHILGALVNGLLYRGEGNSSRDVFINHTVDDDFFNSAISSTISSILQVGASIIFLNLISVALQDTMILDFTTKMVYLICKNEGVAYGVSVGFVEITKGISILSTQKIKDIIVPISTIISFGGLSVMIQSMSFLRKIGIKSSYYILTKISQAILTFAISTILALILYK